MEQKAATNKLPSGQGLLLVLLVLLVLLLLLLLLLVAWLLPCSDMESVTLATCHRIPTCEKMFDKFWFLMRWLSITLGLQAPVKQLLTEMPRWPFQVLFFQLGLILLWALARHIRLPLQRVDFKDHQLTMVVWSQGIDQCLNLAGCPLRRVSFFKSAWEPATCPFFWRYRVHDKTNSASKTNYSLGGHKTDIRT